MNHSKCTSCCRADCEASGMQVHRSYLVASQQALMLLALLPMSRPLLRYCIAMVPLPPLITPVQALASTLTVRELGEGRQRHCHSATGHVVRLRGVLQSR